MSAQDDNHEDEKVRDLELVSEKDGYLWAHLSLKSGLNVIESLNEQFPKFVGLFNTLEITERSKGEFEQELRVSGKVRQNQRIV